MIAAATLRFLDPFGTGKLVLFQVTYDKVCQGLSGLDDLTNEKYLRNGMRLNFGSLFFWGCSV